VSDYGGSLVLEKNFFARGKHEETYDVQSYVADICVHFIPVLLRFSARFGHLTFRFYIALKELRFFLLLIDVLIHVLIRFFILIIDVLSIYTCSICNQIPGNRSIDLLLRCNI